MILPITDTHNKVPPQGRASLHRRNFLISCSILAMGSMCTAQPLGAPTLRREARSALYHNRIAPDPVPQVASRQKSLIQDLIGDSGGPFSTGPQVKTAGFIGARPPSRTHHRKRFHRVSKSRTKKSPPPAASLQTAPTPGHIWVTFSQVDVRSAMAQLAAYSQLNLMLTPGTSGTISLSLRDRTPDEAVHLIAASAGLAVVKANDVYIVGPAAEVQKAVAQFGHSEIMPLQHMNPADAVAALQRAVPTVHAEATGGALIVSGLTPDLQTARTALVALDVAPPAAPVKTDIRVVTLKSAECTEAERILQEAFPALKIARHERTLILTGVAGDLLAADKAIQTLDVAPPVAAEPPQAVVYRLRYLNAQRTEETLKKVFPNLNITAAPEANAPPAANFNPLSGGFQGLGTSTGSGLTGTTANGNNAGGGAVNSANAPTQTLSRSTRLILVGSRADVEAARGLLEQTDLPQPLVRIEAALVEVSDDALESLGLDWDFTNTKFTFTVPADKALDARQNVTRSSASFAVALQALLTKNKARVLASPNISVVDNEDANIFIGDLRRFRGATIISPGVGTVQDTETIPVGIALLVRPRVHPDGNVTLKVHPVVSTVTSLIDGLPQTSNREADTTVRLHEGEQLVIGGLSRTERTQSENRVPILGDIPLVGELFRSRTHSASRTEIIVIIRAYPVLTESAPANDFRAKEEKK